MLTVDTKGTKLNVQFDMELCSCDSWLTLPKRTEGAKQSHCMRGFRQDLNDTGDFHPDEIPLFLWCQEWQKSIDDLGPK